MHRVVQPELLDSLPAGDPEARASRRDLRRLNRLLGHRHWLGQAITRNLAGRAGRPLRVAELGAGDGHFTARLWTRLPAPPAGSRLWLLDLQAAVEPAALTALAARGWQAEVVVADAFAWLAEAGHAGAAPGPRLDLVYANLFVHHFDRGALRELLALVAAHADAFAATEPRRSRFALGGVRLLGLLGCNRVTRHDARASVHAGFTGFELAAAWPEEDGWELGEGPAGLFSHRFRARRLDAP